MFVLTLVYRLLAFSREGLSTSWANVSGMYWQKKSKKFDLFLSQLPLTWFLEPSIPTFNITLSTWIQQLHFRTKKPKFTYVLCTTSKLLTSRRGRGQDGMMQPIRKRTAIEMRLFTSGKASSSSTVLVLKVPNFKDGERSWLSMLKLYLKQSFIQLRAKCNKSLWIMPGLWLPVWLQCRPYRMSRWTNVQIF